MRLTLFPSVTGDTAQPYDISWAELVERCLNPPNYPTKRDCPLIKLAAFGDQRTSRGALRHDANVLAVTGLEGDYDAGQVSPETAASLLSFAGINACIYTSPSHTADAPRWRVLAPLSTEYPPAARRELLAKLNTALGGILAAESFTLSQTFFIGRVAGTVYTAIPITGAPIDTLPGIAPCYPIHLPTAPGDGTHHPERIATAETLTELRSALQSIPADDYHDWIGVGQSLASLGDPGFALWAEWSARSSKHDPDADLSRWQTFTADRTGFASVFARAQRYGWVNPAARGPLDLSGVFGAQSVAVPLPPTGVTLAPVPVQGNRLVLGSEAATLFAGCTYVQSLDMILIPGGDLLNKSRFDTRFGGYSFYIDQLNTIKAKSAWDAFTKSQVFDFPKAHDICFRPELAPGIVIREAGRLLANIWWPVETDRTPGDVTPFLTLLHKLIPHQRDRAILLAYMAAIVQYPGRKFQWCPVVQGVKGNGKSFLGYCVEHAIGDRYSHRPNSADLGNKFTGWLRGKLFICVEEISTHEKRDMLEILKPLITNPRIEIQGKGADQTTGDNRANFMMFVNPKGAMPVDADERRYAVFHSAQQTAEDLTRDGMSNGYFPALYEWARAGGYAHVAHYLATYQIPDELNPATRLMRAPGTSSTAEAIAVSLGNIEQEIRELIESGDTPGLRGGWVSSIVLRRCMDQLHIRRLSPAKLTDALRTLGYVHHSGLPDGRVKTMIMAPDNGKPRLYLRIGHLSHNEMRPMEIVRQYIQAQGMSIGLSTNAA